MRNLLLFCAITVTMIVSTSCKYDDSIVIDRISALEERVNAIEALLKASADDLTIISVVETDKGTVVTFSDNSTITVNNTSDSNTPIVNIEED